MTEVNWTYSGGYTNIESLCCTSKTYIMLGVNYVSVKNKLRINVKINEKRPK